MTEKSRSQRRSRSTWLPGTVADDTDASTSVLFAGDLILLINALRTFSGSGRCGDLRDHVEWQRGKTWAFQQAMGLV